MLRCGVAPRALAHGSRGEPVFLRAPMRAVSCCALPRSRAVYARVCCEKKASRVWRLENRVRRQYSSVFRLCSLAPINTCSAATARHKSSVLLAPKCVLSQRVKLAHVDTSNARHDSTTSPNHVQPNRKRSTPGLIPQEPTKPARVVAKLAALVVLASPPPVRAARRCPKVPSARLTLGAIRARRTRRRRNKGLPKAKGCPNPRRRRVKK